MVDKVIVGTKRARHVGVTTLCWDTTSSKGKAQSQTDVVTLLSSALINKMLSSPWLWAWRLQYVNWFHWCYFTWICACVCVKVYDAIHKHFSISGQILQMSNIFYTYSNTQVSLSSYNICFPTKVFESRFDYLCVLCL